MEGVFLAPEGYSADDTNPFTPDGRYDRSWTILAVDESVEGMLLQRRSAHGCYAVFMTPQYAFFDELFADFIQYEVAHGRKVILVSDKVPDLAFKTRYKEAVVRVSDPRFLVHGTTISAYERICADGLLKSHNRLQSEGIFVCPIGFAALGEPDDYLDHIMFSGGGVAPELVVHSRAFGRPSYDMHAPYVPQVRLYFDGHKVVRDGLMVRCVAPMVFDSLPLEGYLIKAVVASDLRLPEGESCWTPLSFSAAADVYVEGLFA